MPVFTSSIELSDDYPSIEPSLKLNFARSRALDPRITFTRASTATYVGRDGLVKYAGEDEPRFDHDPDTLESLGLLVEESRTNLWANSSDLTISDTPVYGNWDNASRTGDVAVSPDGLTEGDRNTFSTATGSTIERISATAGTVYTFSIYLKKDPTSVDTLLDYFGFIICWSNDGSTLTSYTFPDLVSGQNASDVLTDEWKRFSVSYTCPAGATSMEFGISNRGAGTNTLSQAYSVLCWGAQIEAGDFPTSYIPTSGSAATRAADFATLTGESFSSWFNPSESTLYASVSSRGSGGGGIVGIDNNTGTTYMDPIYTSSTITFYGSGSPGNTQRSIDGKDKVIQTWNDTGDTQTFTANGAAVQSYTFTSAISPTLLSIGRYSYASGTFLNGRVSEVRYYPKALSNAQLQLLTS